MPESHDTDDLERPLGAWLAEQVGAPVTITSISTPEGVGHSNETVVLDAGWTGPDGGPVVRSLVVRLEARGEGVFPTYDLGIQVACLRAVGAAGTVPVPTVPFSDLEGTVLGRPFYVMDRVEGQVPTDMMPYTLGGWLNEATPDQQATLWWSSLEAMAGIHRLDPAEFGFLDRPDHGPAGLGQQFSWWRAYRTWVAQGRENPAVDAAEAWLVDNLPTAGPTGVNWGDARVSNILYGADFRPAAVLDWEMATLGPAEVDLAWFLFFQDFFAAGIGAPDLPGFPERAESVDRYAALLGRDLDDLAWYVAFATWRHSTIMARLADVFEGRGAIPAGTDARVNNIATRMLADLLDLPSPGEPGGPFG